LDESVKNENLLHSQGAKEDTKYNKAKEVQLDWSHLACELPSKARY